MPMDIIQIRSSLNGELVDCLALRGSEMRQQPQLALDAIRRRVEQAVLGRVAVKRLVYQDDEGDSCTLTAASISDALDLCQDGLLLLQVVPRPTAAGDFPMSSEMLIAELLKKAEGLDLKRLSEKVGEAGLELLSELQPYWQEDWAQLIQPLNLLASGSLEVDFRLAQLAIQMYQKMDGQLQQKVDAFISQSLQSIVKELSAPRSTLCSDCGLAVSVGQRCVFCGDGSPEAKLAEPGALPEAVDPSLAAAAMFDLLRHPDKVVRRAALDALHVARGAAASAAEAQSELSWEVLSEAPSELQPLLQLESRMEAW